MNLVAPTVETRPRDRDSQNHEGVRISTASLRTWGAKSAFSLLDQALTSGAGFGVNILLARWMPAAGYGAFALAFAGYLFLAGFHNVLLLEPLSVIGPARHAEDLRSYFSAQISVHGILVLPLAALALLAAGILWKISPQNPLIGALAGGGVALPFLLFLWLARRMCYALQRPGLAVWGSALYLVVSVASLIFLELAKHLGSFAAFLAAALGSLLGASLIMRRIDFRRSDSQRLKRLSRREVLAENWHYGRWLVGSTILYAISNQTQMFLAAGFLGLEAAGALRATQIPSLLMTQIITAAGLLSLPSFAYDFGAVQFRRIRTKATFLSCSLAVVALCFAVALALCAGAIEHALYGDRYASEWWLIPVLALIPVANAMGTGYSMALRASQRPHFDLVANLVAAPIGLASAILFMPRWHLAGAAVSMTLVSAAAAIVTFISYQRLVANESRRCSTR